MPGTGKHRFQKIPVLPSTGEYTEMRKSAFVFSCLLGRGDVGPWRSSGELDTKSQHWHRGFPGEQPAPAPFSICIHVPRRWEGIHLQVFSECTACKAPLCILNQHQHQESCKAFLRTMELFRLEEPFQTMESECSPSTAKSRTNPCPQAKGKLKGQFLT